MYERVEHERKLNVIDLWQILKRSMSVASYIYITLLAVAAIFEVFFGKYIGEFPSKMYGYVASMDRKSFKTSLILYSVFIILISIAIAIKLWFADRLAIVLRDQLVQKIQKDYLHGNTFNDLLVYDSFIDNPDGRITIDIQNWSSSFSLVLRQLIQTPVTIFYYLVLVWGQIGYLSVLLCFVFSILSMIISYFVMKPVMKITFEFSHADASFRDVHVTLKDNAEVVALSRAQNQEYKLITERFSDVLNVQRSRANKSLPLNLVTNLFAYFGGIMEYVCLLIYFTMNTIEMTPAEISAFASYSGFLTIMLISGLCAILNVMLEISKLCGYNYRIYELWNTLSDYKKELFDKPPSESIEFNDVTFSRPTGEILVRNMTFSINKNDSVFITGPSGAGKSSLFRVISRLWPIEKGEIRSPRPTPSDILIFTQRPYLPLFSLYDCVTFPNASAISDYTEIDSILRFLEIHYLVNRPPENWQQGLSPGERQRVAIARLFFSKPKFALLDEATSAIPQVLEEKIFEKATELGITLITIAHNLNLKKFHSHILELDGAGGYTFN